MSAPLPPLPLPWRLVLDLAGRRARTAPIWWLAARPAWRLVRVAADVLDAVAERPDLPAYLKGKVARDAETLREAASRWRRLVGEWRNSPTLCPRCNAPRGDFDGGPCAQCPQKTTAAPPE